MPRYPRGPISGAAFAEGTLQGLMLASLASVFFGVSLALWKKDPLFGVVFLAGCMLSAATSAVGASVITNREFISNREAVDEHSGFFANGDGANKNDISPKNTGSFLGFVASMPVAMASITGIIYQEDFSNNNSGENPDSIGNPGFYYTMVVLLLIVDVISAWRSAGVTNNALTEQNDMEQSNASATPSASP